MERTGVCRRCALPVEGAISSFECDDCIRYKPAYDAAVAAVDFADEARELILRYKYSGAVWLKNDFADWIEASIRARYDICAIDALVPMPITEWHAVDRGYNQCHILAAELARRLDRCILADSIVRWGNPKRQTGLSEAERRINAKGTFRVVRPDLVRGRTLLVIDDIMTTSSTLSECANELKKAGAWRVVCATIARAMR